MHTHARLNAKASGALLYYIPSIDLPSVRMSKQQFDDMRAFPNISTTAKLPGILPVYIGMDPHGLLLAASHRSRSSGGGC